METIKLSREPLMVIKAFTEYINLAKEEGAYSPLFDDVLALAKVGVQSVVPKKEKENE